MELFQLMGTIAIENGKANNAIDQTTRKAQSGSGKVGAAFKKMAAVVAAAFTVDKMVQFGKACVDAAAVQQTAETKLETVMKQRMGSTTKQIQNIKDYTSALQKNGVVGDEVQLSGAQQLATFLNQEDSLKTLIPAMNNLAVQQNGVNVSGEDMVNIGNLMGKVMQGQTGALKRVGVTFTKAQEKVLKYGKEEEKAAMLSKVITQNVGNMNAALLKTDAGKIQHAKNSFGDLQEVIGAKLQAALAKVWGVIGKLSDYAIEHSGEIYKKLKTIVKVLAALGAAKGILSMIRGFQQAKVAIALFQKESAGMRISQGLLNGSLTAGEGVVALLTGKMTLAQLISDKWKNSTLGLTVSQIKNAIATRAQGAATTGTSTKMLALATASKVAKLAMLGIVGVIAGLAIYMAKTGLSADQMAGKINKFTDKLAKGVGEFANKLPKIIPAAVQGLVKVIQALTQAIPKMIPPLLKAAITLFMALVQAIPKIIGPLVAALPKIIAAVVAALPKLIPALLNAAVTLFMALVKAIPKVVVALVAALPKILAAIKTGLVDALPRLWTAIKDAASVAWSAIKGGASKGWNAIKNAILAPIRAAKTAVGTVFTAIKAKISNIVSSIKEKVKTGFNKVKEFIGKPIKTAKTTVASIFTAIKAKIVSIVTSIRDKVKAGFNKVKEFITKPVTAAKTAVGNVFSAMKTKIGDIIGGIKNKVTSVFDKIKDAITHPVQTAKDKVKGFIDKIKSFFNFKWSLPKLKMPHFSVSGKFSLKPPSVPHFKINWYKDGAIFDQPTIFNTPYGLKGVGEAGAEAVAPIDKLQGYVAKAVADQNTGMSQILAAILKQLQTMDVGLYDKMISAITDGTTIKWNDRELGRFVKNYA